jgi:hypothetical protein
LLYVSLINLYLPINNLEVSIFNPAGASKLQISASKDMRRVFQQPFCWAVGLAFKED